MVYNFFKVSLRLPSLLTVYFCPKNHSLIQSLKINLARYARNFLRLFPGISRHCVLDFDD